MAAPEKRAFASDASSVRNDTWIWDDNVKGLEFVSCVGMPKPRVELHGSVPDAAKVFTGNTTHGDLQIKFRDCIDTLEHIRFRRHYLRHCKHTEDDIVILQDIKDVSVYQVTTPLPKDFINFFFTQEIDRFLRALIVYFQLYIQTAEDLQTRLHEGRGKMHCPATVEVENRMRDDLADIRSIVAVRYAGLLLGSGSLKSFHHMASGHGSAAEQDIRLYELLLRMATHVVWIALFRRNINVIEREMNRMFRTSAFNVSLHQRQRGSASSTIRTPWEDHILSGKSQESGSKLMSRSPVALEIVKGHHDFSLLSVGQIDFHLKDARLHLLQVACTLPEEDLLRNGITVGILGLPRSIFDVMLHVTLKEDDNMLAAFSYQSLFKSKSQVKTPSDIVSPRKFVLPTALRHPTPKSFPSKQLIQHDIHADDREWSKIKWKKYFAQKK